VSENNGYGVREWRIAEKLPYPYLPYSGDEWIHGLVTVVLQLSYTGATVMLQWWVTHGANACHGSTPGVPIQFNEINSNTRIHNHTRTTSRHIRTCMYALVCAPMDAQDVVLPKVAQELPSIMIVVVEGNVYSVMVLARNGYSIDLDPQDVVRPKGAQELPSMTVTELESNGHSVGKYQ
jgi:hypothetical protein